MGFNRELRRALDDSVPVRRRYLALRNAVQFFSPNGFNATFSNLEKSVGVTDPDSWTGGQIGHAAELLRQSRLRYSHHRAVWHEQRRVQKASGHREARSDDSTFEAAHWFDSISRSPVGRTKYRWVGLADWVDAHGIDPGPVGVELMPDLSHVLEQLPPASLEPRGSMLAHYGPFASPWEPAEVVRIPGRIYNEPLSSSRRRSLSPAQRVLADVWYSRSHNGYSRQHHLKRLVTIEEYWVVPYVVAALGDYVVEIVLEVEQALTRLAKPGTWHHAAYRQFATHNHEFITLMRQRATSYWSCYYSGEFSRAEDRSGRPMYPAFPALDLLKEDRTFPHQYRMEVE